jgi:hypothetical protein
MWAVLRFLGAAFFVAAFFGATQLGNAAAQERGANDGVIAKVLSLEQLWNQAEVQKDTHSLRQLLADTFIYVDIDGSLIKGEREVLATMCGIGHSCPSVPPRHALLSTHKSRARSLLTQF